MNIKFGPPYSNKNAGENELGTLFRSSAAAASCLREQGCIEIFLDNDPLELIGFNGVHYTPGTFRLFVLPRLEKGKQLVSWLDPKSQFKPADFKHTVKVSPDGYEAEITIPAEKLSGIIGPDVKVPDALPGKKEYRSAGWSDKKRGHYTARFST